MDNAVIPSIDSYLQPFNRKERYWLLSNAIGRGFESLDRGFLNEIEGSISKLGSSVVIPDDAWFAIDYHIDWIYGAIFKYSQSIAANSESKSIRARRLVDKSKNEYDIVGNQEDVDLLIAFGRTMILVEAKFEASWGEKQISRKRSRFRDLDVFQRDLLANSTDALLHFHFVLASRGDRAKPKDLELPWVPLKFGDGKFSRVQRWDEERRKPSRGGPDWRIIDSSSKLKQSTGPTGD